MWECNESMIRQAEITGHYAEMIQHKQGKTHIVILAAGFGTRLRAVSGGLPKGLVAVRPSDNARGLDLMQECFDSIPYDEIILYRRDDERDAFRSVIDRYGYAECAAAESTEKGIMKVMEKFGHEYRYIVCAQDIHCEPQDFARFVRESSLRHAIHWGVFRDEPSMSDYDGLIVDSATKAVIGDAAEESPREATYIKGALHSVPPDIYREYVSDRLVGRDSNDGDFYWDALPFIRRSNRQRVEGGLPSVLNAVPFHRPIFDYGTPERLRLLRQRLSPSSHVGPDAIV